MGKILCIIAFILVCLSLNAQTKIDITPNPCHDCWGIAEIPVLSDSDRVALRLYKSEAPLKWHDFSTYKLKGQGKRAVWIGYVAAGILHGGREAYQADRTIFEKRLGVEPRSFFGSEQWVRQYKNHDPEQPHKMNLFNGFRDYWHMSGATTKYILVAGAFTIGTTKQPIKYKILDTLIGFAGFSLTANLTYNLLR